MLKKLKCLEATASLANANKTATSSNSNATNVKIIKAEPIDFEMLHLEEKDLRERHMTRDSDTSTISTTSSHLNSLRNSHHQQVQSQQQTPVQPQRYQHVQVQTVPPRQPTGLTTPLGTQKIILTPRVEYVQRQMSNGTNLNSSTMKHMYAQHISDEPLSHSQHNNVSHIIRRSVRSPSVDHAPSNGSNGISNGVSPQIIITRTSSHPQNSNQHHFVRRHSTSPSHYQRSSIAGSNSAPSSPPPLLQHQSIHQPQQHSQSQPQSGPPSTQPTQHVRVIRDGRLYDEMNSHISNNRRHSISPPPLHHHTRPSSLSPARRFVVSPHDQHSQQNILEPHQSHQHHILHNGKQHLQYQRQQSSSPTLPPPPPPPVQQSSSSLASAQLQYTSTPINRKYVVTTSRHVNVISSAQQQQSNHHQQQQQQSQHHHQQQAQHHYQQQSSISSTNATNSANSSTGSIFRTPVVSSSSGGQNLSNSSTAMRPPPPPPPPKIKNASPPMNVNGMGPSSNSSHHSMGSGSSVSCEEPSSSIPDLEFDGTTVLCRVCGDKASGFHYGVHSCEGCKGFFRRSIQQKIQYRPCTKNQQCSILRINRNRCQYCRLKKCIAVGMSRDAVRFGRVPKREKARILAAMQQSTQNRGQQRALATELDDQPRLLAAVLRAHLETCEFTKEKVAAMRQRARECPSYSMPTLLACPLNPAPELQSEQEFSQRFAHVIRGVIDFAGMIPGFQLLTQDDKFTLLKAGLFDALFVRLICMFDSSINSIICLNGQVMRRDAIQNGANARFLVDSTFNFAERMNSMNLSDAEIGLFCAIVLITPDRPGLRNLELIEKMYSRLKGCLQSIINQNRPDQPDFLAKLLDTMPDLRTLSTLHTEKLVVFRTEHKELLRQQMWPMEEEQSPNSKSPVGVWDDGRMDVEAKSPLGSVSSTESGDLDYTTSTTTTAHTSAQHLSHHHALHPHQQPSSLASSAPLLAATLSGSCPLRNRANSGSSGDSGTDLDIVGSHAHLTQNGLTITPIVRAHSHQQLHHHLTSGAPHRYRKLDSPTDSGIESGNEKNECGSKAVSSGGSSSCSSPRSSVDDALDCSDNGANNASVATAVASTSQVTVSVSPVRSPQLVAPHPTSTSSLNTGNSAGSPSSLKRQIIEDMPVLKRVLQAPPLYDTNSLMDEAYKPHKKFRALRHRGYETAEADASSTSNGNQAPTTTASIPASSPHAAANSPPPTAVVVPHASPVAVATSPHPSPIQTSAHQSQLHMHLTRPSPTTTTTITNNSSSAQNLQINQHQHQQQQQHSQQMTSSSLSSTHSVLAKSLMAEPRMTPEQIKRSDIIQNYIMRDANGGSGSASSSSGSNSLLVCTPNGPGSRSPAPPMHLQHPHHGYASPATSSSSNSNCASPSTTTVTLASPPPPPLCQANGSSRWPGHTVITTTCVNQRQQSVSPNSNGSSNSSSASSSGCQYFQSPHSTSISVSPPRRSPAAMHTPPRLLELQVDIADSQQPLNLSKKSPTPPPTKLQALVAAASAVQRFPTVSADVTVTATSTPPTPSTTPNNQTSQQVQVHKVMLEA